MPTWQCHPRQWALKIPRFQNAKVLAIIKVIKNIIKENYKIYKIVAMIQNPKTAMIIQYTGIDKFSPLNNINYY